MATTLKDATIYDGNTRIARTIRDIRQAPKGASRCGTISYLGAAFEVAEHSVYGYWQVSNKITQAKGKSMNDVITLQLTRQEANAVLRALATANGPTYMPNKDSGPNTWVANRLIALLAEGQEDSAQ